MDKSDKRPVKTPTRAPATKPGVRLAEVFEAAARPAGSDLDAFPELARAHAHPLAEEPAEVEFAGEAESSRDFLDRQPLVTEELTRPIQPHTQQELVNALVLKGFEHPLQTRPADARRLRQLGHLPVATWVRHDQADRPRQRLRGIHLRQVEDTARFQQTAQNLSDDRVNFPFVTSRSSS